MNLNWWLLGKRLIWPTWSAQLQEFRSKAPLQFGGVTRIIVQSPDWYDVRSPDQHGHARLFSSDSSLRVRILVTFGFLPRFYSTVLGIGQASNDLSNDQLLYAPHSRYGQVCTSQYDHQIAAQRSSWSWCSSWWNINGRSWLAILLSLDSLMFLFSLVHRNSH